MLDVGVVLDNAFLAVASVAAAYTAHRSHKSGKKLDRLAAGDLDKRIRQALKEELATSHGNEIRDLMDAIIYHAVNPNRD